jgi:hypothetical protein
MPYLGNELATQFQAFVTQTITGDGSTGYTLDRAVANGKELLVYINNVKQEEGSGKSYTASGTTITFSEAVASGDSCYVVFLGSAVQTVVPPDASIVSGMIANANLEMPNSLDMNGKELILDADADTSITADTDDQIDVKVAGTDQITIKDGAVSPVTNNDIDLGTSSLGYKDIYAVGQLKFANFEIGDQSIDGNTVIFRLANETETARIDSVGRLFVKTGGAEPSSSQVGVRISGINGDNFWKSSTGSGTTGYDQLLFLNGNGIVGSISTSGSATSYNTSSDYRLKENVVTDYDATTRLKQLKPSRFNFKADKDTTVDGFLAHEVSSIVPEAVRGEKDAVDADGNPKYQGIDQGKLVPLLTKALQEAISEIDILKEKVKALESK